MTSLYRPLDAARNEIRLLKLLPADDFSAPIQCSLSYTFLGAASQYDALSYTWGSQEYTEAIMLDGQRLMITKNLDSALRYLRPSSGERIIWVDAICINQSDIQERNHQVTLMKSIYQHSTADLAWLGPNPSEDYSHIYKEESREKRQEEALEFIHRGMDLMRKICSRDITTLNLFRQRWDDEMEMRKRWRTQTSSKDETDKWLLKWEEETALMALFRRPKIWSRLWVMQELSCAPRVLLVAGHEILDWDVIATFLGDTPYADAFHVASSHGSTPPLTRHVFNRVQTIQHQRGIVRDIAQGYNSTLMDVLARFKFARSTDPRDKLFGLLGLVSEEHGIKVDYGKPAEKIFADVTRFFINSSATLDILCQNPWHIRPGDKKLAGLPSWAADLSYEKPIWSYDSASSTLIFAQRGIFAAGSSTCHVPCEITQDDALKVEGAIIGKVAKILQPDYVEDREQEPPSRDHTPTLPREWMELYLGGDRLLQNIAIAHTYTPTNESAKQAYYRTLMMDCKAYPIERLTTEDIEADEKTFDDILRTDPIMEVEDYDASIELHEKINNLRSRSMWWRNATYWTFAMDINGLYLMLPPGVREGDILAVVDGGKVPVVLRPSGNDDERFLLISSAYVHGYMDGLGKVKGLDHEIGRRDFWIV